MMKQPDMTKARNELHKAVAESGGEIKYFNSMPVLAAIIDALDPQPEQFDWSKVQPGMAFNGPIQNETIFYIGPDFGDRPNTAIFHCPDRADKDQWIFIHGLTRAPAHDKLKP